MEIGIYKACGIELDMSKCDVVSNLQGKLLNNISTCANHMHPTKNPIHNMSNTLESKLNLNSEVVGVREMDIVLVPRENLQFTWIQHCS